MVASGANDVPFAVQAQHVAIEFFQSQNERRYDDLCALFSRGFIGPTRCATGGRARRWLASIRVEREDRVPDRQARARGDHFAVQAVADGAPGLIVLVREDGSLKILAVEGG